jgi:hypothetical protein
VIAFVLNAFAQSKRFVAKNIAEFLPGTPTLFTAPLSTILRIESAGLDEWS